MLVTPWPSLRQALIRRLRSNLVLKAELLGDWAEGVDPQKAAYPLGLIALHYAPVEYDWSGQVVIAGVDVFVLAKTSGEAGSLDQLAYSTLQNAALDPTGQTSLSCRRLSSISLVSPSEEGATIYQEGGIYEVRLEQSNPTLQTLSITADSTIG